ncbi:MAG: B3/4 domain-containing protein [Acidobacteriota bacterium]
MSAFPPAVRVELGGWFLFWAELDAADVSPVALASLRRETADRARATHSLARLAEHPTAAAVRRLFRQAGTDPTRYRPSSEALLRRVLRGEELPSIHPIVDLNNCLSVELVVPACVMDVAALRPPFVLRAGEAGETMISLRGPLDLEGKPLLADQVGAFGTPITDSERIKVTGGTSRAWLVAYLPRGTLDVSCVAAGLASLAGAVPGMRVRAAVGRD